VAEPLHVHAHHPNCLGCGDENPGTLGLEFVVVGERVHAKLRLEARHEGAPGFAHGGAVATALDDTIGTLLVVLRRPAVTARLEVNYRRPVFVDCGYSIEAWIDRIEGRKLHLAASMRDEAGEIVADANALFLEVALDHFLQGGRELPERVRRHWESRDRELPY
jgi:acyl-coenzyme A thioesterase PaaI-like protein